LLSSRRAKKHDRSQEILPEKKPDLSNKKDGGPWPDPATRGSMTKAKKKESSRRSFL
jgi:hypothetical protein